MKTIVSLLALIVGSIAWAQPIPAQTFELSCPAGYSPMREFGRTYNSKTKKWRANFCVSEKGDGRVICQADGCGTLPWSSITGVPLTFPPSAHTHTVSQITDFPATWSWALLTGVPLTFPPSIHAHAENEITNLVTDLAAKAPTNNPTFAGLVTLGTDGAKFAGGAVLQVASGTLLAADLLAISNSVSRTLIPAPGPNKIIVPISLSLQFRFGTTPYVGTAQLVFSLNGASFLAFTNPAAAMITSVSGDRFHRALSTSINPTATSPVNQPLLVGTNSATLYTGGDGVLDYTIVYVVIAN